jgi:hypothetical protein
LQEGHIPATDQSGAKRRPGILFSSSVHADESIGKPVIALGQWKRVLANVAKGLGWGSNMIADDFEDRLTGRAEVQNVRHCERPIICPQSSSASRFTAAAFAIAGAVIE